MSEMSPQPEPWSFSERTQDAMQSVTHDAVQVILAFLPGFGGIGTALAVAENNRYREHLENLLLAFAKELALTRSLAEAQGQQMENLSAVVEDEQWRLMPLMETVFNRMRESSDKGKHERLRRSLATALTNPRDKEQERFVRLVAQYDELEVYILQKLGEFSGGTPRMMGDAPQRLWEQINSDYRDEFYPSQIRAMTTSLEADGLLASTPDREMTQEPGRPGLVRPNFNPSSTSWLPGMRDTRCPLSDAATPRRATRRTCVSQPWLSRTR
jgi:hypothetical protein